MSAELTAGRVVLPIEPDTSQFGANLAKGVGSGIAGIASVGAKVAKVAFGGVAIAGGLITGMALKGGISRALNIQDAQKKLEGLGHSSQSVTKIMGSALAAVKGTAFGLDSAATIAASAVAAGIKPGQELTKYLKLTADTATIAGTSLSDMGGIMNKAVSGGKVYTDTLNQLSDRGIPVFQYLQEHYKVSADELSKMVKKGEVDAGTLQKVLTEKIGGSALKSGETARGAWANVGAAFSRLGAQMATGGVTQAPALFMSIAGATDRFAAAAKPLTNVINELVTRAMVALGGWLDTLDFTKITQGMAIAAGAVKRFVDAFTMDPRLAGNPLDGAAAAGVRARAILGPIVTWIKGAFTSITKGIGTGNFSQFTGMFEDLKTIITPTVPILVAVGKTVGVVGTQIGTALGKAIQNAGPVLVAVINVLAGALGFLADNSGLVAPLIGAIVVALVAYRASQVVANAATVAAIPLEVARMTQGLISAAANFALATAINAQTGATIANTAANVAGGPSRVGVNTQLALNFLGWVRSTAGMVANTVATVASNVAQMAMRGILVAATAAQWLLNAAMSANPIGIVIALVVALVAGLVWFFTQTKLGQAIWAEFTRFLGEAWANICAGIAFAIKVAQVAIAVAFNVIKNNVTTVVNAVKAVVTAVFMNIKTVITAVIAGVSAYISAQLAIIRAVFTLVFNNVKTIVTTAINIVKTVISTGIAIVKAVFTGNFSAIPGIVNGAIGKLRGFITSGIAGIVGNFQKFGGQVLTAIGDLGSKMLSVGHDLIAGLVSGVQNAAGAVVGAITGVVGNAIAAAKSLLGIKSPSRVFMSIGDFIGKGLVKGLQGTEDQVKTATEDLVSKVTDGFAKLKDEKKTLQGDIADLQRRASRIKPGKTKASKESAANRKSDIARDLKEKRSQLAAINKNLGSKGARDSIVKALTEDSKLLTTLAATRDDIAERLKTAQDNLTNAIKVRDDFADNVKQAAIAAADIGKAYKDAATTVADAVAKTSDLNDKLAKGTADMATLNADKASIVAKIAVARAVAADETTTATRRLSAESSVADLMASLADQDAKIAAADADQRDLGAQLAAAQSNAAKSPVQVMVDKLRQQVADTTEFGQLLATLKGRGLDGTSYAQLVNAGVADGLDTARSLVADGTGAVAQIAALQGQLDTAATTLGTQTSATLYQAGVDQMQAVVNGIEKEQTKVTMAIGAVEADMAAQLKKMGLDTTALSKQAGEDMAEGIATGMKAKQNSVKYASQLLGDEAIKALKKRLKIKSPSRVMHEMGGYTGEGFALGMGSSTPTVVKAADAMARIPMDAAARFDIGGLGGSASTPTVLVTNEFNGQMGFTEDQVADHINTRQRRSLQRVGLTRVV